jgi:hypothetical protein
MGELLALEILLALYAAQVQGLLISPQAGRLLQLI